MWRVFAIAVVGVVCLVPRVAAQSTFGSIVGVVDDPSNAPVAGASVQLRSLDDNSVHPATSDENGAYEFVNLKPGNYALSLQAEGFADFQAPSATLQARQTLRIDVMLSIKAKTEAVEVIASVPLINTENGVLGDEKVTSQITQLPLNFRASTTSPLAALSTSPNVQQDSQGNIAIGGATANMVGYSVDGISTTNIFFSAAGTNPYPSAEGIAELKVTAFNNNAEFSQVGDVTFTTKAGTNNWHGSLFEYFQNDALDAKVLNFDVKAPKRFNTFGGSLGGPVVIPKLYNGHNKTFFFLDYEGNRKTTSQPEQFLVPTLAQRNGNLNGLNIPNNALINPFNGQPFPNNTIPASLLNSSALTLLNNYYPLPNVTGNNSFNYENLQPVPSRTDGFDTRIDQIINAKQQVYARYNWKNVLADTVNPLLPNDVNNEHDRSFLISHNISIRPTLLNEFRFGFTQTLLTPSFAIQGAAAIAQLGLLNVDVSHHPTDSGFPTINFSDGTGFTPLGRDHVGPTFSSTKQITDNITYIRGRHTLRAGVDIRWVRFAVPEIETPSDDYGLFAFNQGVFTGNAFGNLLLGVPTFSYFDVTGPRDDAGAPQSGYYLQDEWRVNDRLTVNAGVRWELQPPMVDQHGIQANFDPETNTVIVNKYLYDTLGGPAFSFLQSFNACNAAPPGFSAPADAGYAPSASLPCTPVVSNGQAGLPPGLRQFYKGSIDPRIGIAYRPFKDNTTVFRAGFGIFTVTNLGQLQNNNESNPEANQHNFQNIGPNGAPLFQFPQTVAASQLNQIGGATLGQATDPHYRDPQSAQWNVTVEQGLSPNTAMRVSYVGMNSYRLNVTVNLNQIAPSAQPYVPSPFVDPRAPFQNWGIPYSTLNLGSQNYQAMQVEVTHKTGSGLSFQANYTWAHDISDAQGDGPTAFPGETSYELAVVNRFGVGLNRGNVEGVRRHRFLLTGAYQLPFGQGRRWSSQSRVVNGVLGGWSLNTVTLIETGPYLTPTISPTLDQTNTNPVGSGEIVRPDLVGNPTPANQTPNNYFDVNAFAPTPVGAARVGNAGVGILEGPGTIAVNAGLSKVWSIRERMRMRFEATFTNALNHTNFAPPATNVSNPQTFGVLESAQTAEYGGNRTGQLALRLDF
jgi:hypothetical protein